MSDSKMKFSYQGSGKDCFVLFLKNILLTIVTFGIYRFWAEVAMTKYIFRNSELDKAAFDYHATGKEKFVGFLKGAGLVVVGLLVYGGASALLTMALGPEVGQVLSMLLLYLTIIALQPLIIIGKRKYDLSRSSWKMVRFGFDGEYKELAPLMLKGVILTGLTLGIYAAWFFNDLNHFYVKHSRFGHKKFSYHGEGQEYFKIFYLGYLLSIITLGLYSFKWRANLSNYYFSHVKMGEATFESEYTGMGNFLNDVKVLGLIMLTLGFGMPWAITMSIRYHFSMLSVVGDPQLEDIFSVPDLKASSLAEGVSEAAEAVGNLFG